MKKTLGPTLLLLLALLLCGCGSTRDGGAPPGISSAASLSTGNGQVVDGDDTAIELIKTSTDILTTILYNLAQKTPEAIADLGSGAGFSQSSLKALQSLTGEQRLMAARLAVEGARALLPILPTIHVRIFRNLTATDPSGKPEPVDGARDPLVSLQTDVDYDFLKKATQLDVIRLLMHEFLHHIVAPSIGVRLDDYFSIVPQFTGVDAGWRVINFARDLALAGYIATSGQAPQCQVVTNSATLTVPVDSNGSATVTSVDAAFTVQIPGAASGVAVTSTTIDHGTVSFDPTALTGVAHLAIQGSPVLTVAILDTALGVPGSCSLSFSIQLAQKPAVQLQMVTDYWNSSAYTLSTKNVPGLAAGNIRFKTLQAPSGACNVPLYLQSNYTTTAISQTSGTLLGYGCPTQVAGTQPLYVYHAFTVGLYFTRVGMATDWPGATRAETIAYVYPAN